MSWTEASKMKTFNKFYSFKSYRSAYVALATGLSAVIVVSFQNCSKVPLQSAKTVEEYVAPSLSLEASVCPDVRKTPGTSAKYIFVIDMSASNVGDWDKVKVGNSTYSYWDKSLATDVNGDRFKAVEKFLDTCGNTAGNEFAIIGFSKTAGIITGSGPSSSLSCTNVGFSTSSQAKSHLANLKSAQTADAAWYYQWDKSKGKYLTDPNSPPILGPTSYVSALGCAEKAVVDDLTTAGNTSTQNYHLIFISDGAPKDATKTGCNSTGMTAEQSLKCHMDGSLNEIRIMRQSALSRARDLRAYGVFYGPNPSVPIVMDAIAKEGGTSSGTHLTTFSGNESAICGLVLTQNSTDYQPDSLSFIDLTTVRKDGLVQADSDMDGLTDSDELTLGSDPQNARSLVSGVLDGTCQRLGGQSSCQTKRSMITCDPNLFVGFGMTQCDVKIINLDKIAGQNTLGTDADADGILDYIEIIKGTNPAVSDMTLDPDGDGIVNKDEIIRGTDINSPDADLKSTVINNTNVRYSPASEGMCPYGGWSIEATRLQTAKIFEAGFFPQSVSVLNHNKNQHVLMAIYRLTPTNDANPITEYYGQVVKVNYSADGKKENLSSVKDSLSSNDFILLGSVKSK